MPENKGEMDQLFPWQSQTAVCEQIHCGLGCTSVPWNSHPTCSPKMPEGNKWFLSLNGKYRNLNTLMTFVYRNQTRRQSPENGTVEKYLYCLLETSSADITATSGKTVDCIVI